MKRTVKEKIYQKAHEELFADCKSKKKLVIFLFRKSSSSNVQPYIFTYSSEVAQTIFRLRAKSTNCRSNRGSTENCRLCWAGIENQEHVINCIKIKKDGERLCLSTCMKCKKVIEIARFQEFERLIKEM